MGSIFGGKSGGNEAAMARVDEINRQQRVRDGTARINQIFDGDTGFNDGFFTGRREAYSNYAMPQLEQQFADAQKQLTYSLARGGNLDASVRGDKMSELEKLYTLNKQKVADDALAYETSTRTSVEDARNNLLATLNATGDAEGAANAALARSTALSKPAAFSPLEQLFAGFTSTLGNQAAQERAAAASGGSYKPAYNTGLFGNTGRVSVVG